MIFKVFEKFDIDLRKHIECDWGDTKVFTLNLGDFDALKYAENIEWGCLRITSDKKRGCSIIGYLPTINFNGVRNMLTTYTNTGTLRYGQNVKIVRIIVDKFITNKNFDIVVANVRHFMEKFDEQELKIKQFLMNLDMEEFKTTVNKLNDEIKEKQKTLEDYKEKFYKNIKSQLSVNKDFQ